MPNGIRNTRARNAPLQDSLHFAVFLVLEFLHGVRDEFIDDVSETAVGPIFTGHA